MCLIFVLNECSNFQYSTGRSNQLAPAPRIKLRRTCRQQAALIQASRPFVSASVNCGHRGDDHQFKMIPAMKSIKISDSSQCIKQTPSNVKKHFVRMMNGGISSLESPHVDHQQAIRNYLNQTASLPIQQRPRAFYQGCGFTDTEKIDARLTRSSMGRSQPMYNFDDGCIVPTRLPTTCDKPKFLDSHSQNQAVITASFYKNLCNRTIGW